jgi:hypothetical protein
MKTLTKISCVAALALGMTAFGTLKAEARPWFLPPLPRVGIAIGGPAVGVSVAASRAPIYGYPGYGYPSVYAGYPAVAPVYYAGRPWGYGAPYRYGYGSYGGRVGWGRGWGNHYGYRR